MRLQYFPTAWKEATIILLPKEGKLLSQKPRAIPRPISLFCTLSKFVESIIVWWLDKLVKESNILPNFQHGFQHHRSTLHQLIRLSEQIADNLNKSKHMSMLLLDAKQAFDRVWHDGLILKLIIQNYPHYLIGFFQSWSSSKFSAITYPQKIKSWQSNTKTTPP